MSTGHTVRHIGPSTNPHRCSVLGCSRVATYAMGGYEYCTEHRPLQRVTQEHVRVARVMMLRREWSLAAIATDLGVGRSELDLALWQRIAEPFNRIPSGDF